MVAIPQLGAAIRDCMSPISDTSVMSALVEKVRYSGLFF
jgi:hypothetical protein